ncbi:SRPBCC domain-containing protein [Paenibacillus sp. P96]|uniref:SRPBCC domain-containing protein n=1 Tax=Paenibacillus zeirhizosphaerae TaxID=2987519 RepID=A0ABT9FSU3_9BACL|nr:SRPBCC domain-containing protein [Paenibacillus sp. P96]MDP4097783.1 SRPBCC domain-containing protein [Paenibacillus sp. P96]
MMTNSMIFRTEGQEVFAERTFDAPRELVFKAFTEAEHLKHWWGPRGWELTVCNIDFRPGGVWHYCMKCMDQNQGDFFGVEAWGKALYHEIVQGEKIVYSDYFSDAEGNTADDMPATEVTLTFIEQDGKTKVVNRALYASADAVKTVIDMGMQQGFTETWDRLAEYMASAQ